MRKVAIASALVAMVACGNGTGGNVNDCSVDGVTCGTPSPCTLDNTCDAEPVDTPAPIDAPSTACNGVTCSGHGTCNDVGGAPLCQCDGGFVRDTATTCVAATGPTIGGCPLLPVDHVFNTPIDALPTIPATPQPAPDDLLVTASVGDPLAALAALVDYADAVQPGIGAMLTPAGAIQLAASRGLDLRGVDLTRPVRGLLLDPRAHAVPVIAVVAVADEAALRAHCAAQAWPEAAQALNRIRQRVAFNLVLGALVVLAAVSAR